MYLVTICDPITCQLSLCTDAIYFLCSEILKKELIHLSFMSHPFHPLSNNTVFIFGN